MVGMGKRHKGKERERLVQLVRTTGEPVKAIAERMGVKASTAYFWMKRAREAAQPEFARVIPTRRAAKAAVSLEVGGVIVHLESGFDADLLREVVSALGAVETRSPTDCPCTSRSSRSTCASATSVSVESFASGCKPSRAPEHCSSSSASEVTR
jgi:transposase-like protein